MKFRLWLITYLSLLLKVSLTFAYLNHLYAKNESQHPENRMFGFTLPSAGLCSRLPETKKEILIGPTFQLLCDHFGFHLRDKIINSVAGGTLPSSMANENKIFHRCLKIMTPKIMSCLEKTFDNYDLIGTETPPTCMSRLAILPKEKFQLFWLIKFPIVHEFIEKLIKGYKMFSPVRKIVEKFLNQGIMERWQTQRPREFEYAKIKSESWKALSDISKKKRMKKVFRESPDILDICEFSREWLHSPGDFEGNHCLIRILGNILVLENIMQADGMTLESEFISGKYLPLHLLHVVKSVLRGHSSSRRSLQGEKNPVYPAVSQVYKIKAASVKCMNEFRKNFDDENKVISHLIRNNNNDSSDCLNTLLSSFNDLEAILGELHSRDVNVTAQDFNMKIAYKLFISHLLESYKNIKFTKSIIENLIKLGIPEPNARKHPWANEFMKKWRSLTISNNYAKLDNAFHATNGKLQRGNCENLKTSKNKTDKCWKKYISQIIIIEQELMKNNLSLQLVFLGDPFLMNIVYLIDKSLEKYEAEKLRILAEFRAKIGKLKEMNGTHLNELAKVQEDLTQSMYQELKRSNTPLNSPGLPRFIETTTGVEIGGLTRRSLFRRGRIADIIFKVKRRRKKKLAELLLTKLINN